METSQAPPAGPAGTSLRTATSNDTQEAALIAASRAGDHKAFEELLSTYEGRIYRCGLRMMGNAADAADILQNVALKMYRHLPQYEGRSRFSTWLIAIAFNECRRTLRDERHQRTAVSLDAPLEVDEEPMTREIPDWHDNPEQLCGRTELQAMLTEALQQLSPWYREVFLFRDVEGFSIEETAEALGITAAAVKSRLLRARLQLREILEPRFACPMRPKVDIVQGF